MAYFYSLIIDICTSFMIIGIIALYSANIKDVKEDSNEPYQSAY